MTTILVPVDLAVLEQAIADAIPPPPDPDPVPDPDPAPAPAPVVSSVFPQIIMREVQGLAEHAGGIGAGDVVRRDLNTLARNVGNICTLAGGQFTLPAGHYLIRAVVTGYRLSRHDAALFDVTNNVELLRSGPVEYGGTAEEVTTKAELFDVFELTATTVLEIRQSAQSAKSTNGLGVNAQGVPARTNSIYTQVWIWAEPSA